MKLKVIIEEQNFSLGIDPEFLQKAAGFFDKMDSDMDKGWQMGREWVERPTPEQKLIIVADKLLTALENNEKNSGMMMAGYIKSRAPQIAAIEMDVTGEMGHDFQEESAADTGSLHPQAATRSKLNKMDTMQTGQWKEAPAIADKQEAENMREFAFKKRFDELTQ